MILADMWAHLYRCRRHAIKHTDDKDVGVMNVTSLRTCHHHTNHQTVNGNEQQ